MLNIMQTLIQFLKYNIIVLKYKVGIELVVISIHVKLDVIVLLNDTGLDIKKVMLYHKTGANIQFVFQTL